MKRILIASYIGNIYLAVVGMVMVPIYLHYLGSEAYGLIGFFVMLQAWLRLLDFGLTPTLSRELSRYRAGSLDGRAALQIVQSLEWLFGILAVTFALATFLASSWIAVQWLNPKVLSPGEVASCIAIMGIISGIRWFSGLYRSGLIGLEKQVPLNVALVLLATVRSIGVVLVLKFVSSEPVIFFSYQGALALVESVLFQQMLKSNLPRAARSRWPQWSSLRGLWRFAGAVAFTSAVWAAMTQLDKLVLSHFLSLEDYGFFSLAVTASGGIMLLSTPIQQALQPRLTVLEAQQRDVEFIKIYRTVTQFMTIIMAALAGPMAVFAEPLIYAWTGNAEAARQTGPILFWYALGNGLVGLLFIPYMLQYARGYLRLHWIGVVFFSIVWLPVLIYASKQFGAVGAGFTWLSVNLLFLLIWVPIVHVRLAPELAWSFLVKDIAVIVAPMAAFLYLLSFIDPGNLNRMGIAAFLILTAVILCIIGALTGDLTRSRLTALYGRIR